MTAATLDLLSGGRFLLGLGTSGPQVVEAGTASRGASRSSRRASTSRSCNRTLRREQLEHHGAHYDIPVTNGTGLGKPLKLMARPLRADIPIYLAVMGKKAVAQAFEIADGWLPIFWSPEKARDAFGDALAEASRRLRHSPRPRRSSSSTTSRPAGEFLKPYYALYIGGMGARGQNFYNDLGYRYGFEDAAREIQDYLPRRAQARDAAARGARRVRGRGRAGGAERSGSPSA